MDALPAVLGVGCVAVVALAILALVLNARRERRRRDRLIQWCRHHGWTITANPAVDWGVRLPGGNRRGVTVAFTATIGGRVVSVAEYSYSETHFSSTPDGTGGTSSTTTTQTHRFVATVVRLNRPYPAVAVQPRGALSKLGRTAFGGNDTAGGDPRFDRTFRVTATDPDLVRQLITPALVAEHLAGTVPSWTLYGHDLLAYQPGHIQKPQHIPGYVTPLLRVAQHFRD